MNYSTLIQNDLLHNLNRQKHAAWSTVYGMVANSIHWLHLERINHNIIKEDFIHIDGFEKWEFAILHYHLSGASHCLGKEEFEIYPTY